MLKLGVVDRSKVREPRTLLGRRRNVSLLLLRELALDAAVDPDEYDRLAGHARMPNGVWKLTHHGRLRHLDTAVIDELSRRYPPGAPLVVCDVAASTGATSVDFFRALKGRYDTRFIASDLYRDLVAVRSRRWPLAVVFDGSGREVQYLAGKLVLPESPPESAAYPVNHAAKALVRRCFVPAARVAVSKVPLAGLAPFEMLDSGDYQIIKLPMLTKDALAAIAAGDGFAFEEWNIFESLPTRAHVVRAMNILTPEHFPDEMRATAIRNCVAATLPGGLFVIGSSPSPNPSDVKATIYGVEPGQLTRVASLNGGSEVDAIVTRIFSVVGTPRIDGTGKVHG